MTILQNLSNFLKKATNIFIFCCFFTLSLQSSDQIQEYILENRVYEDNYFKKLLHYKGSSSEIDSTNFFISKNGKYDLKEELFETIDALKSGEKDVLCRFPLRVSWLEKTIPNLKEQIKYYECKELNKYKKELEAKHITLVFPSSHINSPASMYGHTFLQLSSKKDAPLLSNALNYAAKTNEKNGLVFAFKGVFGGYEGQYSILPYYEKLKTYNNIEQRDVWEYDLNFNQEEIDVLVLHAWELKDSYADYFFFKENCSYALLWLLEIARPSLELTDNFTFKAIPLDTIKLVEKNGLISGSNYRYSNLKKMKYILNEKIENKDFIDDYINKNLPLNDNLSTDDKISYLDFKIAYTQYLRSEKGTKKDEYVKNYLNILKQRSQYNKPSFFDVQTPTNPLQSHGSARASLYYDTNDSVNFTIKPAYHNIYDLEDGYLQGAYIDFFEFSLQKKKDEDIKVDKITLLKIESFSPRDKIFKPLTWTIDTGYEKFIDDKDSFKINPSFGATFGEEYGFLYTLLDTNAYFLSDNQDYSIGARVGAVTNYFKDIKLGVDYRYAKYDKGFENKKFEAFSTIKLVKDLSLSLKYQNNDLASKQDIFKFGLMFYFVP